MVAWSKITRPFFGHFVVNLIKTIFGSALVGYGIAQLQKQPTIKGASDSTSEYPEKDKPDQNDDDDDDDDNNNNNKLSFTLTSPYAKFLERYIYSFVMIGAGLYFTLPSLASQMLWEAAIPAITATEVAQDLATDSVFGYIKSWKPETATWPLKSGGGSGTNPGKIRGGSVAKSFVPSIDSQT